MDWWGWLAIGWGVALAGFVTGWIRFQQFVRGDFDKGAK